MAGHAWLDSLSEDWVSQAPSEGPSVMHTPTPSSRAHSRNNGKRPSRGSPATGSPPRNSGGRIPRICNPAGNKRLPSVSFANSSGVLSERSINNHNALESQRGSPAKATAVTPTRAPRAAQPRKYLTRRSVSESSTNSVIHNTVHQKKASALSHGKVKGDTPEWRRRLIDGELAYGEQRDLFSSAATGLENIFKPPPPAPKPPKIEEENDAEDSVAAVPVFDTTVPSSPPVYRDNSTVEIHVEDLSVSQLLPGEIRRPSPRPTEIDSADQRQQGDQARGLPGIRNQDQASDAPSDQSLAEEDFREGRDEFRKVSNGSVLRNESFSPIFIARRGGEDGQPSFAPMEVPPMELRKRLDKLRLNQMVVTDRAAIPEDPEPTTGSNSLNPENAEDYEKMGGFINTRRGGRSAEGSFLHRMLSPETSGPSTSEMFLEESLQASTPKQFPTVRTDNFPSRIDSRNLDHTGSPRVPQAPNPSPEKAAIGTVRGGSGSPLKLFGPYDTFTNQTLMRRISQFEDQMTDLSRSAADLELGDSASKKSIPAKASTNGIRQLSGRDSSAFFGEGDLDGYEFTETFAYRSRDAPTFGLQQERRDSQPVSHLGRNLSSSPPAQSELFINRQRTKLLATPLARHVARLQAEDSDAPTTPGQSDSKRQRISPIKDPTPKRRRTLHKSDVSYVESSPPAVESVQSTHRTMQSIMGRKRKNTLDGSPRRPAGPAILANRQVLRPRSPTPSQRSSVRRNRKPFVEEVADYSGAGDEGSVAVPVTESRLNPVPPGEATEGDRKPSIKTEDFLNEANKIMAMIRNAGPRSGLTSVEESDEENGQREDDEDSFQESTREPFSRPPSRDGPPLPRATVKQVDPEVLARLRKYEEKSDIGDIIGSSVRSLGLAQDVIRTLKEAEQQLQNSVSRGPGRFDLDSEGVISDPPNIRISRNPSSNHDQAGDGHVTHGSVSSWGHSTGRSIPTGSSRGSDTCKTIAPQTISHLIPDQVGNMVLDRERNVWVKSKGPRPAKPQPRPANALPSDAMSEEDPFADIPDLSVDMTLEMQRIRIQNGLEKAGREGMPLSEQLSSPASVEVADETSMQPPASSPVSAKQPGQQMATPAPPSGRREKQVAGDEAGGDVEHEIGLDEGRGMRTGSSKKRNLTITFSSPVASIIQDAIADSSTSDDGDLHHHQWSVDNVPRDSLQRGRYSALAPTTAGKGRARVASRVQSRAPVKQLSLHRGSQSFVPRPVSRIDEQDEHSRSDAGLRENLEQANGSAKNAVKDDQHEQPQNQLSVVPDDSLVLHRTPAAGQHRPASLSFVLRTPARPHAAYQAGTAAVLNHYVGNLSLSPMSDFTAHHGEPSAMLEASYVVGNTRYVTGDGPGRVLSQSLADLVSCLSEFEPFEPYWEDLTELELIDKKLTSLHKLSDFCGNIVHLDVSRNSISNLSGVPDSVRFLRASHNQLSDLTAWGGLMNLQYLDVSNNDLRTVSGLSQLVHLRNLTADNCNLASLDGLRCHEGLQKLRARGNHIEELDFEHSKMRSLTELDLEGSGIRRVVHIERLTSLAVLNLVKNKLDQFEVTDGKPFSSLTDLYVTDNELMRLDVGLLPMLKRLLADRNRLHTITGFTRAIRLDSLSLREQRGSQPLDTSFLGSACEVRKLYLSGNMLGTFEPPIDFLNLQLLELANCGLRSLPARSSDLLQNLRKLNVNFNAISSLSCLAGITRLKKISAAGNRIRDVVRVQKTVGRLPSLRELDLRGNPTTIGFYAPANVVPNTSAESSAANDEDPGPFAMAPADMELDSTYRSRLDTHTQKHRRLYELMWASSTKALRTLDGLSLDRGVVRIRDSIWHTLIAENYLSPELLGMLEKQAAAQQSPPSSPHRRTDISSSASATASNSSSQSRQTTTTTTTTMTTTTNLTTESTSSVRREAEVSARRSASETTVCNDEKIRPLPRVPNQGQGQPQGAKTADRSASFAQNPKRPNDSSSMNSEGSSTIKLDSSRLERIRPLAASVRTVEDEKDSYAPRGMRRSELTWMAENSFA
ncbi:leucine-rich repeat-containing protein 23 [Magnaporthiopsis poae ATCC 64411]|uniref:Leucine-rich repeat-containing protein 23 n=1 Tax=Magnaporthiopsis poae (strain ATCC 64411 / 73-15) TaxID=644358 RepID=A0A0C4DLY8_MAGP6|nr:leucine-rich repeat-containing protein 23 [Magnaporthiopsis poae ATCC 64411]